MKKTNNFNYFTQDGKDQEKKKATIKKVWKWIKITLYAMLFGLTITGCVQSFVLKNSSNVGNGIEFYIDQEDIGPKVNTLTNRETKLNVAVVDNNGKSQEDNTNQDNNYELAILNINQDKNVYLNNKEVISNLNKQSTNNGGKNIGQPKVWYSSVALDIPTEDLKRLGYNETTPFNLVQKQTNNESNQYLFIGNDSNKYTYLNEIKDIILLDFPKPGEQYITLDTHSITEDKKTITTNKVDENKNFTLLGFSGLQKIIKYDGSNEKQKNVAFARDILQTFYDYSFGKKSKFINSLNNVIFAENKKADNSNYNDFSEYLIVLGEKLKNNQAVKISQIEREMINTYQQTMVEYLSVLGLLNKADIGNDKEDSTVVPAAKNQATKYDYQENVFTRLGAHIKDKTQINDINTPFRGDHPIEPITNWGQAWGYGPFYGLLVYPLSALTQSMRQAIPELGGWGSIIVIIISLVITRLLMFAITFKSKMMQSVQEGLRTKKAAIEAKYVGFEKNKAMKMKKNQEIQALYAKYNISPLDQFGSMLITMPVFFAMWRVIQGIPEIKQTVWLGLNFSSQSWTKVLGGEFIYLWILIVTIGIQVLSQMLPKLLERKKFKQATTIAEAQALKKSERTQKIMVIVFAVITILFTVGVQVYWLFGGLWQILEVLILHKLKRTKWFKERYSKKILKDR
ncbi:membrane protein insertase YidC [Mycoplasmopsis felis]|uniref:membrane protein insertase YidC n=1 Tax=Mycoplasmopsis felis TaxID=33923 RepID=UPI000563C1B9|nr:membrane protein insertase YidC [Mycoplasmopsis felis]